MAFDSRSLDDYVDVATRIAEFRERFPNGSLQPADPAHPWEQAIVNGIDKTGKPYAMTMIVYVAAAYRTPDDPRPGIGVAWEPFPGRTGFTLGSELMNAETSAWGRAIVAALAADARKGVASAEEIRNRDAERDGHDTAPERKRRPKQVMTSAQKREHDELRDGAARGKVNGVQRGPLPPGDPWTDQPAGQIDLAAVTPEDRPGSADSKQLAAIGRAFSRLGIGSGEDDRNLRLQITEAIIGRELAGHTSKDLSYTEASAVLKRLATLEDRAAAVALAGAGVTS